jgi:hypothetical protein
MDIFRENFRKSEIDFLAMESFCGKVIFAKGLKLHVD